MKDPLIEWLVGTTPLKRDRWVLECALNRIILNYINGRKDQELIKNTHSFILDFMITHNASKTYEDRTYLKILVEECSWGIDDFINLIEEKKGRI